jgi:hypothetical protein
MHNSQMPIIPFGHKAFDLLFCVIIVGRHVRVFDEARDFFPLRSRVLHLAEVILDRHLGKTATRGQLADLLYLQEVGSRVFQAAKMQ